MKKTEFLIYQTPDGDTRIDARLENETLWLTQFQLAELFQTTKQNISLHLKNIFEEGELDEYSVVKEYLTTASDGKQYRTYHYNLDAIISVGYRVKSHVATRFRMWATQQLREYIIKGFVMDDERLKEARNSYFDELLQRIRDIRSSEKVFYRKVCDIFATSIDYDGNTELSKNFFASVQNKFHWAIHGETAAETVYRRADAQKPNMGLTNWPGNSIKKNDIQVAKNYLKQEELDQLNRIVNQFLEFAELQAMRRSPMYMKDWNSKITAFLTLNDREILEHRGEVSANQAKQHALREYENWKSQIDAGVEDEWDKAVKKLNKKP